MQKNEVTCCHQIGTVRHILVHHLDSIGQLKLVHDLSLNCTKFGVHFDSNDLRIARVHVCAVQKGANPRTDVQYRFAPQHFVAQIVSEDLVQSLSGYRMRDEVWVEKAVRTILDN